MNTLNVAIIGTGWCGGIRAVAAANHPIVADLHIAETNPERLAEMIAQTNPASAVDDWQVLVA
ncbi:MAG: putative dehydrogenase, partial [Ilumatobacter sp.]